jgi:hypothetical protein
VANRPGDDGDRASYGRGSAVLERARPGASGFNLTDEQLDKLEAMQVQCELEKIDLLAALRKAKIRFRSKATGGLIFPSCP